MNAIHECYGLGKLEEFVNDETPALTAEALLGAVWKSNLRRVRPESPRQSPCHRRGTCSMAWRCRFLTARRSQPGRVIATLLTRWLISTQSDTCSSSTSPWGRRRPIDEGPDPDDRRDVVHAVLGLGAVVLLHARVAVDREGYATPAHHAREPRKVEVVGDAHACVSGPSRRSREG